MIVLFGSLSLTIYITRSSRNKSLYSGVWDTRLWLRANNFSIKREVLSLSLCSLYQGKILTETERDIGRGFSPPRFNSLWDLSDRMYVGVWALKAKIRPKCLMDFISVSISFLTQWSFSHRWISCHIWRRFRSSENVLKSLHCKSWCPF